MRRTRLVLAAVGLALAFLGLGRTEAQAAASPVVYGVFEGKQSTTAGDVPTLTIVGANLTKFNGFFVKDLGDNEVGTTTLVVRSKTMLVLTIDPSILPGVYKLQLNAGKPTAPVVTEFLIDVSLGAAPPGSVVLDSLAAGLQTDLADADTLGGNPPSFFQDAGNLASGALDPALFSAYADLVAEAKIGTTPGTVAAGDHVHDARYYQKTELNAAGGTPNAGANPVDWSRLKGIPADIADGDGGNTYANGAGILLSAFVFSVDFAAAGGDNGTTTQASRSNHVHDGRYFTETELQTGGSLNTVTNPVDWTKLKSVPAGFADGVDADTTYSAGTGLSLSGTLFAVVFAGAGGDLGSAASVAHSDHLHDGRYYTETELNASGGTINTATNPLDWTRLKGVPAGFADGVDDDTTYSASTGLTLTGTAFSVNYAGTGAANFAARSDHTHTTLANALALSGNVAGNLFSSINSNTGAGSAGVFGQVSAGTVSSYGVYGAANTTAGRGVYGTGAYGVYGSGNAYGLYGAGGTYGGYGSGTTFGLYGQGGAYGVYGYGSTYGVYGNDSSGVNYGVFGVSSSGYGVYGSGSYGTYGSGTSYGAYGSGGSYGVYGSGSSYGVFGSASNYGVRGDSTSSGYGVWGSSGFLGAYGQASSGTYGVFAGGGTYGVYGSGSSYGVYCSGNFAASGTKSFVQKHPKDSTKAIVYVCLEGGEAGTYCRGKGRLVGGEARVELPEHFTLVTAEDGITAQVTPTAASRGLYVAVENNRFLVVRENAGGTGDATFNWTVNGLRAGFEHHEPISSDPVLVRALNNEGGTPEQIAGLPPRAEPEPAAPPVLPPAPQPAK